MQIPKEQNEEILLLANGYDIKIHVGSIKAPLKEEDLFVSLNKMVCRDSFKLLGLY